MPVEQFFSLHTENFLITYDKQMLPLSMPMYHYHNSYELYYLVSGERYYFIKDKCYKINKGNLVFINTYDVHYTSSSSTSGYERYVINFKKDFLKGLAGNLNINLFECFEKPFHVIEFTEEEQLLIDSLFSSMMKESRKNGDESNPCLKSGLLYLLTLINRHDKVAVAVQTEYINSTHKTISEIAGYINNNFEKDITLDTISKKFFISPCYFSRSFKKFTGLPFIDYLNSVRIKEAQSLLQNTDLSIFETGERVGFRNATHFGRVFKKITGVSPLAYKKTKGGVK